MSNRFSRYIYSLATLFIVMSLFSCGGGGSGGGGGTTGTLGIRLTDATMNDYQAVYVTIEEISIHHEVDGWSTLTSQDLELPQTFNLLVLINGVMEDLGVTELEAGHYNQMRLKLGTEPDDSQNILSQPHEYANYLILEDEVDQIELKVPSGLQTGIKLVNGFDIIASGATELVLDFDAAKSVVRAGNSGKWLLKPTIKVLETVDNFVSGVVDDGVDPIEGAVVSAQFNDSGATDLKDEVNIESATVTDGNGAYVLYIAPGTYNIVAVKEGFGPGCTETAAPGFEEYTSHFSLVGAASGTASGTVSGLATDDDFATLSFRQMFDCGSGEVSVEVKAVNVSEGGNYSVSLPVGDYQLVTSAEGETTHVFALVITVSTDTIQDINY